MHLDDGDIEFTEPRCKFCAGILLPEPDKKSKGFVFFKCIACGMSNAFPELPHEAARYHRA